MASATLMFLALSLWPFHGPSQTVNARYEIPAWKIGVERDRFTGKERCRLYQGSKGHPSVRYARGTLGFQFSRRINTLRASYRFDDGAVKSWTEVYPELVQTGATLEGRSLDNPTSGTVLLPLSEFHGSHSVTIRAAPKLRPRRFSIDGLSDALGSARALGCDVETGFVR